MAGSGKQALLIGCALLVAAGWACVGLYAQRSQASASSGAGQGGDATPVVIEREALRLIDPRTLHVPLVLASARAVELTAGSDGFVQTVRVETGQPLQAQAEALRLDGREQQLLLDKARAGVRVAEIEVRAARNSSDPVAVELAEAKLDVAKADVELATLRLERTIVRAPFDGHILHAATIPGAYVRAGESLATLADLTQLQVEIPVDRSQTKVGDSLEIRVENQAVQGSVTELLPLAARFEPLRTVIPSVASATLLIDNGDGRFAPGQTVYVPLVPRQPVVEIPTETLFNSPDGTRQVQVLRRDTVREIEVELLGAVGADRIFVSGAFAESDELVLRSSQVLSDGMRVRPATPPVSEGTQNAAGAHPPSSGPARVAPGERF